MATNHDDQRSWKQKNRPYIYAAALALILTMFVAPEIQEGYAMSPTIDNGNLVLVIKEHYSEKRGIPEIGTVVVLQKDQATEISKDNLIARVVGLPGETISIKDGQFLRDGKVYTVKGTQGDLGEDMEVTLGSEEVFLLCDNRDLLQDSRSTKLGPIDMKIIRGNARFILWPFSEIGGIK
jgi:signal peptidase I